MGMSVREMSARSKVMNTSSDIPAQVDQLLVLLEERGTSFVLVGGIAMLQYVPGRATEDIDFIVAPKALEALPEIRVQERDKFFLLGFFEDVRVDCLLTSNKLFRLVDAKYTRTIQFLNHQLRCASPDGLALLKLYALPAQFRNLRWDKVAQYEADLFGLVTYQNTDLLTLLPVLKEHLTGGELSEVTKIAEEVHEKVRKRQEQLRNLKEDPTL